MLYSAIFFSCGRKEILQKIKLTIKF